MEQRVKVGTVNILEPRVYPRDPSRDVSEPGVELVSVDAGQWPVYLHDGELYWEMSGYLTRIESRVQQLDASTSVLTFGLSFTDVPTRYQVIFRSKSFSLTEFGAYLLTHPLAQSGPEQRLVFDLPGLVDE